MFSKIDPDEARVGRAVCDLRVGARLRQRELGALCVPPITAQRLSLIERGRAMRRPSETAALVKALPGLAAALAALLAPRPDPRPAPSAPSVDRPASSRVDRSMPVEAWPFAMKRTEAATALSISTGLIDLMVKRGELKAVKCGRLTRICRDSLVAFLAGRGRDEAAAS